MLRHDSPPPQPTTLVALMVGTQVLLWTLVPAVTHDAPPLDVVESGMWGREWVIATYKHPAMPSWLLEVARLLTGTIGWPAYLISQLFVAATFAIVFVLGRDLMGAQRAVAGTLLLAGVAYYAWPTPEFNHNVAEMPFWAGVALALWRAVERRSAFWWAMLGALAAGGLHAKLATSLLLVTAAAWILYDRKARQSILTPGPWIGLAVFVALMVPFARWLVANDFQPMKYAMFRATLTAQTGSVAFFLLNILLNLAGMLAMLATAGLIGPRRRWASPDGLTELPPVGQREKNFLLAITAGPLVVAIFGTMVGHAGLKSAWGSSMFNLAGLLAVALTSTRLTREAARRVTNFAAILLVVVPLCYGLFVAFGYRFTGKPLRANWPAAEIAQRMESIWRQRTGQPLRIVSGETWVAGLVGTMSKDKPSIFTYGDYALSPWITPQRLEKEGMLVVWDKSRYPWAWMALYRSLSNEPREEVRFKWRQPTKAPDLAIDFIIVPPKPGLR